MVKSFFTEKGLSSMQRSFAFCNNPTTCHLLAPPAGLPLQLIPVFLSTLSLLALLSIHSVSQGKAAPCHMDVLDLVLGLLKSWWGGERRSCVTVSLFVSDKLAPSPSAAVLVMAAPHSSHKQWGGRQTRMKDVPSLFHKWQFWSRRSSGSWVL